MTKEITNQEAIQMMNRCKAEILGLRRLVDHLRPKAEAYDNLAIILRLLPQQNISMGEDVLWILDKRIRELSPTPANEVK